MPIREQPYALSNLSKIVTAY